MIHGGVQRILRIQLLFHFIKQTNQKDCLNRKDLKILMIRSGKILEVPLDLGNDRILNFNNCINFIQAMSLQIYMKKKC